MTMTTTMYMDVAPYVSAWALPVLGQFDNDNDNTLMVITIRMTTCTKAWPVSTWAWPVVRQCDNDKDNMLMARKITMTMTLTWVRPAFFNMGWARSTTVR